MKAKTKKPAPMKVWKFGVFVKYANWEGVKPSEQAASDWKSDIYESRYWMTREECEAALAEEKERQANIAMQSRATLATDPALAERIRTRRCTMEDRGPHYEEMSAASRRLELAEWVAGFVPVAVEKGAMVWRLNTLPTEDNLAGEAMRKEIRDVLEHYGYCTVRWSCMGHTRSRWQTSAVVGWVEKEHPEWSVEVEAPYEDCTIRVKKAS